MAEHYESEAFIYNQVPVRIFNHSFDGTDIFTSLHWHRNVEFNLTTEGRIKMNIDGKKHAASSRRLVHCEQRRASLQSLDRAHGPLWRHLRADIQEFSGQMDRGRSKV